MKIEGYKLVSALCKDRMEEQINKLLRDGWTLRGHLGYGNKEYWQAMVRYAPEKRTLVPMVREGK